MIISDLQRRIQGNRDELIRAVESVIDGGRLVMGPGVSRFQESFAEYLGVKHCIGVANGTDAIEIALRAVGVQGGDRVATVANAGMYTTTALQAIGSVPFFLDVDPTTYNTTLAEVERALVAGVNAIVVTHLYGLAVPEISAIAERCSRAGVPLLEDCAQSHGARIAGRCVGTFGDAASFSFYPTKNLGALGDGGAVVTNSDRIANNVSKLHQYGWSDKYRVEVLGARNSRLDEIQAAILSVFLPKLDEANNRRRTIANFYSTNISSKFVSLPENYGENYVAHLYVVRTQWRDELRAHLKSLNIATDIHYPIPDHRQPAISKNCSKVNLPITERLSSQVMTLPCYPELTNDEVHRVAQAVNSWKIHA